MRTISAAVFAFVLCSTSVPVAPVDLQEPGQQDQAVEHAVKGELHHNMEALQKALKAVRRNLKDEAKDGDSLALVAQAQTAILVCKLETPERAAKVPEGERAAFVTAYRKEMVVLLSATCELEDALLDHDRARIQAAYDKLHEMEEPAHERFVEEE